MNVRPWSIKWQFKDQSTILTPSSRHLPGQVSGQGVYRPSITLPVGGTDAWPCLFLSTHQKTPRDKDPLRARDLQQGSGWHGHCLKAERSEKNQNVSYCWVGDDVVLQAGSPPSCPQPQVCQRPGRGLRKIPVGSSWE